MKLNKKNLSKVISTLGNVKNIMGDEQDFFELRKKDKQAIFDLLIDRFDYDVDCDSDGAWCFINFDSDTGSDFVKITFFARSESAMESDIRGHLDSMELQSSREWAKEIDKMIGVANGIEMPNDPPIALLNTSILTTAGTYNLTDITLDQAKEIIHGQELDSAVGHDSTAEIMTTLLCVDVPVNRQMFTQEVGQQAIVFKLNGRPAEGKILTLEDIQQIGYKFQLLERQA